MLPGRAGQLVPDNGVGNGVGPKFNSTLWQHESQRVTGGYSNTSYVLHTKEKKIRVGISLSLPQRKKRRQ